MRCLCERFFFVNFKLCVHLLQLLKSAQRRICLSATSPVSQARTPKGQHWTNCVTICKKCSRYCWKTANRSWKRSMSARKPFWCNRHVYRLKTARSDSYSGTAWFCTSQTKRRSLSIQTLRRATNDCTRSFRTGYFSVSPAADNEGHRCNDRGISALPVKRLAGTRYQLMNTGGLVNIHKTTLADIHKILYAYG